MKMISLLLVMVTLPATALAWGNRSAHPVINQQAFKLYLEQHATATSGGGTLSIDEKIAFKGQGVTAGGLKFIGTGPRTLTIKDWLSHGGFTADEPEAYAAWRHFYDPHSASGSAFLTDHVPDNSWINPQVDARTWALSHADNAYNWQVAFSAYREAFEGKATNGEESFARAFRAVGETMHMMADMTQPAHVRNDAHARAEPIEDTLNGAMVTEMARGAIDPRCKMEGNSLDLMLDVVARFVNEQFYSADTIYNAATPEVKPANGQTPNQKPQFSSLTWNDKTGVYYATFNSVEVPMAMETFSSYLARKNGHPGDKPKFMIPQWFTKKQAAVLVPIAVKANMLVLQQFVPRLSLELKKTAGDGDKIMVGGTLSHDISGTGWTAPLSYSGPGRLYKRVYGKDEGELLGEVTFQEGAVVSPLEIGLQSDSAQVYLQVRAGGLIMESKDADLSSAEPQICINANKDYAITWSMCVENMLYSCCVDTVYNDCASNIDGEPTLCEKGCACESFTDMGVSHSNCMCKE